MSGVLIREYRESDRVWAESSVLAEFGGALQARRGELLDVLALQGFVAEREGRPIGLLMYRLENDECELAFIAALERHTGVGTALLEALRQAIVGCKRIWLVTTNDNLDALRFYGTTGLSVGRRVFGSRTGFATAPWRSTWPSRRVTSRRCRATSTSRWARACRSRA